MKTQLAVAAKPGRSWKAIVALIAVALLLAAGLFLASVIFPPLAAPVHALNAPMGIAPRSPAADGVNGTLASFTALFQQSITISLPFITH